MINANEGPLSIPCIAMARCTASIITCHPDNLARIVYESRCLPVSHDDSIGKDGGPEMGQVSVIPYFNENRARSCRVYEYKD